ncbi:MAG: RNA polymerase sigma factor [Planctomycetes bacterium]|nr:RNA polymerase sigma factor [Planctomycetota bacterium]
MDAATFDALIQPLLDRLYAAAWRVTGREADARDALQEALLRIYQAGESFAGRAAFATWAHRIVVHCAIDQLRAQQRPTATERAARLEVAAEVVADPRAPEGHQPMLVEERAASVRAALERLPERQRLVLALRHYEEMPLADIAETLGIALGTVKATLCQGLRNLRRELEPIHEPV